MVVAEMKNTGVDLAELHKPNDVVEFAVDGLEDTNHIYRCQCKV